MASTAGAVPASCAKIGLKTKLPRKIPRNPLISLDSDEEIQGNPRNSNPHKQGFRAEMGRPQENPNGSMPFDKGFSAPSGSPAAGS
jgi:hypothetical protein